MIAIDPTSRPTFDSLLHSARGTVFPETFYSFLHNYVASVNEPSPSIAFPFSGTPHHPSTAQTPTSAVIVPQPLPKAAQPAAAATGDASEQLPSDSDHRMERIWSDYESVEPYLLLNAEDDTSLEQTIKDPVSIEFATSNAGIMGRPFQVCHLGSVVRYSIAELLT